MNITVFRIALYRILPGNPFLLPFRFLPEQILDPSFQRADVIVIQPHKSEYGGLFRQKSCKIFVDRGASAQGLQGWERRETEVVVVEGGSVAIQQQQELVAQKEELG